MNGIDWKKVAEENGLGHKEFIKELMLAASCAAVVELDKQYNADAFKFTCSDDVSDIELYVRRV